MKKIRITLLISFGFVLLYSCAIHIVNGTEYDLLEPENQAEGNFLFFEGDSLVEVRHSLNEAK